MSNEKILSRALHINGNKILNDKGEQIKLAGVNVCGHEWDSRGLHILDSVYEAFTNWNCNIVRLPLSQDRWFGKGQEQTDGGEHYRKIVDDVIDLVSKFGKYVDLDLHWSNMGEWGKNIDQHYMPDEYSVEFWINLAKKYKNHPAVLFGLYNEPHDVLWEVWRNGGTVTEIYKKNKKEKTEEKSFVYTTPGHQKILDKIRAAGANNIIIAGGLDWAYDLRGIMKDETTGECYALKDAPEGSGIIYDSHIYPMKEWDGVNHASKVLCITESYPIIIGEIGIGPDGEWGAEKRPEWLRSMLDWIDKNNLHFTGWCLHPSAGPSMISDWNYIPTKHHGAIIKERLLSYPDTNSHLDELPKKSG